MRDYRVSIEIKARPERVFPFLVEPDRLRAWFPGFVESRPLTDGGPRVGTRSIDVIEENGRRVEFQTEISRFEPNRRLEVAIEAPLVDAVSDYQLEPRGDITAVAHHQRVRYKGWLRLLGPFFDGIARRRLEGDLARLREAVEAEQ
jgi:uncharacterized protein YndB with AHSA1/START domain